MSKNRIHSNVAFVSPYELPPTNNLELLQLLSKSDRFLADTVKPKVNLSLPTSNQFDASEIIELNNTKILSSTADQKSSGKSKNQVQFTDVINEDEEPKFYIDIGKMRPKNLMEEISTVILNNFPSLRNNAIEKVLVDLVCFDGTSREFEWSAIGYEFMDHKTIFIRLHKLVDLQWLVNTYKDIDSIIPNGSLIYSDELDELKERLAETLEVQPSVVSEQLKNQTRLVISNSKNRARPKTKGFEDLDLAMQSYSDYKVDNNDLIDVANDMKEGIVKDIIRFRTKMLSIEKENRRRRMEQERVKTRHKLSRLIDGLKETKQDQKLANEMKEVPTPKKPQEFTPPNEYYELSDKEYEVMMTERELANDKKEYERHLSKFKAKEEVEKEKLKRDYEKQLNYESDLLENKLDAIDRLRNYQQNGLASLYENDYNEYLKQRHAKRSLEEEMDARDIENENENENQNENKDENKDENENENGNGNQELNKQNEGAYKKQKTEKKLERVGETKIFNIKLLPADQREQIASKINDLLVDCLGVEDDLMHQIISENLDSHNLDGKESLVAELVDVLEEDAEKVVDDLYEFVVSIASKE
ncbi:uncharacterized protein LODBEIA_P01800 [Lodderomyces beijingensis]|uniref:U1 small nuclear ribonucleoprotein component SNU71 n=1 Tax=Lodderomyces beijingensis TaxID=1775926 RepID=A0ABP0ZGI5_9ASCO